MKIDPRVSLFSLISFFFLLILSNSIVFLLGSLILFIVLIIQISSLKRLIRFWTILLIPTLVIIGLNWFFVTHDFNYHIITILRFWSLSWVFNWYLLQTTPDDLAQALWSLYVPYKVAWQISLAYRYLPMFQQESQRIYQSQVARGIPIDQSYRKKLQFLPSLAVPLLVLTQDKAMLFAEALYARHWNFDAQKSMIYPLYLKKADLIILIFLILLIVVVVLF